MSRPTVDQASKQNIGDSEFGIRKFGCFDDVSKIFVLFFGQKQSDWLKKWCKNSGFIVSELVVGSGEQDM